MGQKSSGQPFTFPDVECILNVAELMDNILTHARLSAQAALQEKVEFLAIMSRALAHDLRNLITPVSSFLVHTDGRYPAGSDEAEVHAAAQRSLQLMNDYLRETLLFAGQTELALTTRELSAILKPLHDVSADRAATRGVSVVIRCESGAITADVVLLQRLLANLVGNAIDASRSGQAVVLSAAPLCPGWVRFEVSDQGCGIPPDQLGRIFEPYFTTKQHRKDVRGFGLGLTICQKIVALHHGKLAVDSRLGIGTTMTVDLPADQPAPVAVTSTMAHCSGRVSLWHPWA